MAVPAYVQRMEDEHKDLRKRMHALRGFINNGKLFQELPEKKKELMHLQLEQMVAYGETLQSRINLENK